MRCAESRIRQLDQSDDDTQKFLTEGGWPINKPEKVLYKVVEMTSFLLFQLSWPSSLISFRFRWEFLFIFDFTRSLNIFFRKQNIFSQAKYFFKEKYVLSRKIIFFQDRNIFLQAKYFFVIFILNMLFIKFRKRQHIHSFNNRKQNIYLTRRRSQLCW